MYAKVVIAACTSLHVGRLCLLDRLVELVARLHPPRQVLVDLGEPLREARELLLDLGLLLLVAQDRAVHLLALLAEVLDTAHELVIVGLKCAF